MCKSAGYSCCAFVLSLGLGILIAAPAETQAPAKKAPSKAGTAAQPKFKAIWEPVNVKEDLELHSVHFVSAEEGWVAGGKPGLTSGVIYHTTDGGANWQLQAGDPSSAEGSFTDLRFLDAKTGFAVQSSSGDHQLLRTTDGENWLPVGNVPQNRTDYVFVSPQAGFYTYGSDILRTSDAGKKWQSVFNCNIRAEVQGLTREVQCEVRNLFFLNPSTGFAISREVGSDAGFVFAKTADGGETWAATVILPGETGYEGDVHFIDENNGLIRTKSGKLFRTSDGGDTWAGVPGQIDGNPRFEFADGAVGWMAVYQKLLYTNDGGKRWLSSALRFPTLVTASSLPARDRGYVIGDHGMVYRYRIVPVEYTGRGVLPATAIAGSTPK